MLRYIMHLLNDMERSWSWFNIQKGKRDLRFRGGYL